MGVTDVPQWLLPAYVQAMSHAGATASREQLRDMGTNLITLWSTPDRAFHNLRHLIDLLTRVDELSEETRNPDLVRLPPGITALFLVFLPTRPCTVTVARMRPHLLLWLMRS